ncbi:hypothetical protein E6O75_ATG00041 [Venturia nashicola]|uniref:Uncharacterized protein n=1 Tax=Venturia nashicola TaxID=86259 RepID=A0A4Z1PMM4_9PEZI|nr:hypothetical protein E6O75_ATG00041 [Venturia nashicola]
MPRLPWRSSPAPPEKQGQQDHAWLHRFLNFNLQSTPNKEIPQEPLGTPQIAGAPTPTTPTTISPLLLLPPELRQKILNYTITSAEISNSLLYESVKTSSSTWEARVYYFDSREFAWDDESIMLSRAPFQDSQTLSSVHPLLKEDMDYVKRQWLKRVRAIGEEKRREVLRDLEEEEAGEGSFLYRGFGEGSRFPKGDVRKRIASNFLMN